MNLQISVLQNDHQGKDTHIRQVKLFGPRKKGQDTGPFEMGGLTLR